MPIYCDESGSTGYDLIESNQPYFVFSALNIEEHEANDFIKFTKSKYKLQGEPKGANWVKSERGKRAITELFQNFSEDVKIVYHHKKYALACKYYEYVFEPTISEYNRLFYRFQFHRFIANLIYEAFKYNKDTAEDLFIKFQELIKGSNLNGLFDFLETKTTPGDLVHMIAEFTVLHRKSILKEITTDGKFDYWILDLAQTALHGLLSSWSLDKGALEVIVDESGPLLEAVSNNPLYQQLNAKIKYWDPFGYGPSPMNFALKKPLVFQKSKDFKGLQMADLFASSVYWALKNPHEQLSKEIRKNSDKYIPSPNNLCIFPEPHIYLEPFSREYDFGVTALNRLLHFSRESEIGIGKKFLDHMLKKTKEFKTKNLKN